MQIHPLVPSGQDTFGYRSNSKHRHLPGKYSAVALPIYPVAIRNLRDILRVRGSRDRSFSWVQTSYKIDMCEADAVFRVFEDETSPTRSDKTSHSRTIVANDIRRICKLLMDDTNLDKLDEEVMYFLKRFKMIPDGKYDEAEASEISFVDFVEIIQKEADERQLTFYESLFLLLDDPTSSSNSLLFAFFILSFIVLSSISSIIETMNFFHTVPPGEKCSTKSGCISRETCPDRCIPVVDSQIFRTIESVSVCIFTIEYICRLALVGLTNYGSLTANTSIQIISGSLGMRIFEANRVRTLETTKGRSALVKIASFIFDPMNVIDLLAIIPYYLDFFWNSTVRGLNIMRLLRIARLFRMTSSLNTHRRWIKLISEVVMDSLWGLKILSFIFFLGLVIFSSLIYFAEQGQYHPSPYQLWQDDDDGTGGNSNFTGVRGVFTRPNMLGTGREQTPFNSIPRSMWFVITTGPTTGFGDYFPTTKTGKVLSTFLVLSTMLILAFPLSIISKNMTDRFTSIESSEEEHFDSLSCDILSILRRHHRVKILSQQIIVSLEAQQTSNCLNQYEALAMKDLVYKSAQNYANGGHSTRQWDECVGLILPLHQRQSKFSRDFETLNLLIHEFLEALLS